MTDQHPVGLALENRLMSHGIYVTDVTRIPPGESGESDSESVTEGSSDDRPIRDGAGLVIAYETLSEDPAIGREEVSAVVRTLLGIAEEREWSPGRLEARSLTAEGAVRGRWHVERAWFEALGDEFDELEFSRRVLETRRAGENE